MCAVMVVFRLFPLQSKTNTINGSLIWKSQLFVDSLIYQILLECYAITLSQIVSKTSAVIRGQRGQRGCTRVDSWLKLMHAQCMHSMVHSCFAIRTGVHDTKMCMKIFSFFFWTLICEWIVKQNWRISVGGCNRSTCGLRGENLDVLESAAGRTVCSLKSI